jgi:hypothetical protein
MAIEVGAPSASGSIWPMPPIPTPISDGELSMTANIIPHNGTLINQVEMPTAFSTTATGDYVGILSGATIWTVNATDVNAACDGWCAIVSHWYDSVNDRLYVFGLDTGTTPDTIYTAYITLEDGVVTPLGSAALSAQPASVITINQCATNRAAIDSGNFTLKFNDRTIALNESNGAEISNVASVNVTQTSTVGAYTTLDGTITLSNVQYSASPDGYIIVTRNGISARIALTYNASFQVNLNTNYFSNWGDKAKFASTSTATNALISRTWLREEFDEWLALLCDYAGI